MEITLVENSLKVTIALLIVFMAVCIHLKGHLKPL